MNGLTRLVLPVISAGLIHGCTNTFQNSSDSHAKSTATETSEKICKYSPGQSGPLIIGSTLLTLDGAIENGALVVLANGKIGTVDRFETVLAAYPESSVLDCRGTTVLSPGWINAHEHEAYSYAFPSPDINPNYKHRDEWRFGVPDEQKPKLGSPKSYQYGDGSDPENRAVLTWVELRHLLSGTTTLAGSGAVPGLVKNVNLHKYPNDENLYPTQADNRTFPLSFSAITDFAPLCGGGPGKTPTIKIDPTQVDIPYVPHVGEGARDNCTAQQEVKKYIEFIANRPSDNRRFSLIHGVAASEKDFQFFADHNISLVWSPRSNMSLYGQTIDLGKAIKSSVNVALATDWSPSGSFNMLEEFDCAKQVATANKHTLQAKDLWRMATFNAAYVLGQENTTGQIKPGLQADIVLAAKSPGQDPFDAITDATQKNILAVWVDGRETVVDRKLTGFAARQSNCLATDTANKNLCLEEPITPAGWEQMVQFNEESVPLDGSNQRQAKCIQ